MSEQFIDIDYKIPCFHNPLKQYYLIQWGWIHTNMYDLQSQVITLNIARYWYYSNYWQHAVHLHWYINDCIYSNGLVKTYILICPGININRMKKKGQSYPYWGGSHRYSIYVSAKNWKSDVNFIIVQLQNVQIQKILKKHRFLIRHNIGWIKTDNLLCTVPLFRFFFIKNCNIRGYKHKFISIYDGLQYTKSLISTIEYQYNLFGKWWGAIFLDTGEVTNKIKWDNLKSGFGFGIRWQLPVGPIQLDIAIPLMHQIKINHKLFYFYINLGSEL